MVFLRYESFREYIRLYPVTVIMLAINMIMFIVVTLSSLPTNVALIKYGAIMNYKIMDFETISLVSPQLHTYVTSIFLHNGFQHLLFNSFSLFVFAPPLERMIGHMRYALLYVLSGIAGNVLSELVYSNMLQKPYLSVGASGAVYGIFGAFLYLILFRKDILDHNSRKTVMMILGLGAVYSFLVPKINLYAHLGGMLCGLGLLGVMIKYRSRRR